MSSSAAAEKALEGRGVFESFAQAAGLNVRPFSITQPDPPDIRCEIEVLGPVGFELVQLDVGDELQCMKYLGRGSEFTLSASHVQALREAGKVTTYPAGT